MTVYLFAAAVHSSFPSTSPGTLALLPVAAAAYMSQSQYVLPEGADRSLISQISLFNLSPFLSVLTDRSEAALQLQRLIRRDLGSYDKGFCSHCYITELEITQPRNSNLKYYTLSSEFKTLDVNLTVKDSLLHSTWLSAQEF